MTPPKSVWIVVHASSCGRQYAASYAWSWLSEFGANDRLKRLQREGWCGRRLPCRVVRYDRAEEKRPDGRCQMPPERPVRRAGRRSDRRTGPTGRGEGRSGFQRA